MQRHAYLITAYDNLYILEKTIRLLDHARNDIFIHCDIKMGDLDSFIQKIKSETVSSVYFTKRQNVRWGDYTYTDVILGLLQTATATAEYGYYHLITGTSMPIKTQQYIHHFFDTQADGRLYFHINVGTEKFIQDRVKAYYPLVSSPYFRGHKWIKGISELCGKAQMVLGINRLRNSEFNPVYNGWGWFSIPHDFATYCVSKRALIEKTFRYTLAADEMWIHTVAMHSPFRDKVYGYNGKEDAIDASKHFQDWKRGKPYTFTKEDFDLLMKDNPAFFARKFDQNKDREIIDLIFEAIQKEQM